MLKLQAVVAILVDLTTELLPEIIVVAIQLLDLGLEIIHSRLADICLAIFGSELGLATVKQLVDLDDFIQLIQDLLLLCFPGVLKGFVLFRQLFKFSLQHPHFSLQRLLFTGQRDHLLAVVSILLIKVQVEVFELVNFSQETLDPLLALLTSGILTLELIDLIFLLSIVVFQH